MEQAPATRFGQEGNADRGGRKYEADKQGVEHDDRQVARPARATSDRLAPPRGKDLPGGHDRKNTHESTEPDDGLVGEQSLWHGGPTSNPLDPPMAAGHYSIRTLNDITTVQSMSSEAPKQVLFAQFALVAKAAGHPLRLELLEQLAQGDRSVEVLADRTHVSLANASQHLQHLRRAGLVTARREGKFVFYRLAEDSVLDFLAALRCIAERHLAEVDRVVRDYFGRRDSLEPVTRRELLARLKAGLTTVLDVRPEDEFALGHLQGAVNIPLAKLKKRLAELDPDKEIVAYCRGPYCVLSYEAVATLRSHGFSVRRLEDGFPEWRAAGLPVETGFSK